MSPSLPQPKPPSSFTSIITVIAIRTNTAPNSALIMDVTEITFVLYKYWRLSDINKHCKQLIIFVFCVHAGWLSFCEIFRMPLTYSTLVSAQGHRNLVRESPIRKQCKCKRNCYLTAGLFCECGVKCYGWEIERLVQKDVVANDIKEHHRNNLM